MAKNLDVILLYDFYGPMLTDKQADMIDLYYNEDLSLAEISEHTGITRQGVRDSIKRAEAILFETEEKLGLVKRYQKITGIKQKIDREIEKIEQDYLGIAPQMERIKKLLNQIED